MLTVQDQETPALSTCDGAESSVKRTRWRGARKATVLAAAILLLLTAGCMPYWHLLTDVIACRLRIGSHTATVNGHPGKTEAKEQNRRRVCRLLKLDPAEIAPGTGSAKIVEDAVTKTMMFNGEVFTCRRQTLLFKSNAGAPGFGYLLLPEHISPGKKLPCIICIPGHGAGVDHAVGIDSDGSLMKMWDGTPRDFALFYACRGYAVLAIEQLGIGRRAHLSLKNKLVADLSRWLPAVSDEKAQCFVTDMIMRYSRSDRTMLGQRVADAIQAVNLASAREEIDAERLAMMGISAGGTTSLFTAALDERIKCAIVVSAFGRFNESIFAQPQCTCNYVPGLPAQFDLPEIAGLIAPRGLFIESGTFDDRFPIGSARLAFNQARNLFASSNADNNIEIDICNHGHRCFFGTSSVEFLKKHL